MTVDSVSGRACMPVGMAPCDGLFAGTCGLALATLVVCLNDTLKRVLAPSLVGLFAALTPVPSWPSQY